ncbi:MAG: M23 family metallopeptidase [Opitutales bacterium]|nr:M23 family metallopeptidase [Opitutales bacterium]
MKAILIALTLTIVVVLGLRWCCAYELPGVGVVLLYFLSYGLLQWHAHARKRGSGPDASCPDRSKWPLSGPLGRLGQKLGGVVFPGAFLVTNALSLLNPFQAVQIVRQLLGNARLRKREKQTGDDLTGYRCKAKYRLPVEGEWLVHNGGDTPETSHSWDVLGQRYALDLVRADAHFRRHSGNGGRLAEYFCYGENIVAAADGTVVSVEDRVDDAPLVGWGFCDFTVRHFAGSHVIIRHAEGEFALYAHLIKGSLRVLPGDAVRQGEVIGRCGHSGHSTEPHLHFHLQDSPDLFHGMGLPIQFDDIIVDGSPVAAARIRAAQRVRNAP